MKECDEKFKAGLDELYNEALENYKKEADKLSKEKRIQQFCQFMWHRLGCDTAIQDCMHDMLLFGTGYLKVGGRIGAYSVKSKEVGITFIHGLMKNPSPYSLKDISVGSVVKVRNGRERFWVTVKTIHNTNSYITGVVSNELLEDEDYDFGDTIGFYLNNIWDIEEPKSTGEKGDDTEFKKALKIFGFSDSEQKTIADNLKGMSPIAAKPEDTYKPGDRVVFVKNRIYRDENNKHYVENVHLGIINNYSVNGSGNQYCTLEKMFNIMNIAGLKIPNYLWGEDISNLINKELFEKSLERVPEASDGIVYGLLEISPVDEKHFPKLNSIVAKIPKPGNPKPYNPMKGSVFIEGMGWFPE